MFGKRLSLGKRVILYTRTLAIPKKSHQEIKIKEPCVKYNYVKEQMDCNDPLILVDTFEDKSRIATLIDYKVLNSDPEELIHYMRRVAEFGFDHIIIIGETEYGMIFLDCYGRVFLWDDESQMLWPFGNSPEEAPKRLVKGKDQLRWFVMNGIVYEYITKWQDFY
jgi:hypothetical protein